MEFTAATIAGFLKGEIEGNPEIKVNTIAKIEEGHPGALSFWQIRNMNIISIQQIIGCSGEQEFCPFIQS